MLLDLLKRGNSLAATTLLQDGNPVQLKVKQVLAVNVAHDLALLETGQRVDDYLRFIDEDALGPGEQLFVMGYLDGFTRQAVPDGMVYEDIFSFAVATDFPDLSGMSGSPILNASGRVVGVGYVAEHNVLYGVKTSYAKAFVAGESGTACSRHASLQSCLLAGARQVEDMAAGGDLRAIYELGEWPSNVHDIDSSMGNDLDSLMEAARQDYAPAEFDLGMLYAVNGTERCPLSGKIRCPLFCTLRDSNSGLASRGLPERIAAPEILGRELREGWGLFLALDVVGGRSPMPFPPPLAGVTWRMRTSQYRRVGATTAKATP